VSLPVLAASTHTSGGEVTVFWLLAIISVAAALGMIFMRKTVHSALLLAVVMLSLAVLYVVNDAPFLGLVQVIVYTGAVLMLFLFVVMIVGVSSTDSLVETIRGQRLAAAVIGIAFAILLFVGIGHATFGTTNGLKGPNAAGNVMGLAELIFTRYVFAFEITSALLITAALAAMVLAHRESPTAKPTQKDLAIERFKGEHPTPLPGPGTYARHNAVDMPALLPDGTHSELSVSPVIARRPGFHVELHGETPAEAADDDIAEVKAIVAGGEHERIAGGEPKKEEK
jgi:NADH-quinone oxidoreductase subunit J